MKNKIMISILAIFILLSIQFTSAEIFLWQDTAVINDTQIVRYHAFYQFEDTSASNVGRNKPIDITLSYDVEALPYPFLTFGVVDYCNFTVQHYINEFDEQGFIINTSYEVQNIFFGTNVSQSGEITTSLVDKDTLIADMDCHYTDVNSLYEDSVLVGRYTTFMPSFECKGCGEKSLEELSKEIETNEAILSKELTFYRNIQNLISMNFQLWIIISWFIKISLLFVALGLLIGGVYILYKMFEEFLK